MKEQNRKKEMSYEELFVQFSNGVERVMLRLALVIALLLVLVQFSLQFSFIRQIIVEVERLEGIPFLHPTGKPK